MIYLFINNKSIIDFLIDQIILLLKIGNRYWTALWIQFNLIKELKNF